MRRNPKKPISWDPQRHKSICACTTCRNKCWDLPMDIKVPWRPLLSLWGVVYSHNIYKILKQNQWEIKQKTHYMLILVFRDETNPCNLLSLRVQSSPATSEPIKVILNMCIFLEVTGWWSFPRDICKIMVTIFAKYKSGPRVAVFRKNAEQNLNFNEFVNAGTLPRARAMACKKWGSNCGVTHCHSFSFLIVFEGFFLPNTLHFPNGANTKNHWNMPRNHRTTTLIIPLSANIGNLESSTSTDKSLPRYKLCISSMMSI